jgi:hypothetical protein
VSTAEAVWAIVGFLIIAFTVWQVKRRGIADSNGNVDDVNSQDHTLGGGWPD